MRGRSTRRKRRQPAGEFAAGSTQAAVPVGRAGPADGPLPRSAWIWEQNSWSSARLATFCYRMMNERLLAGHLKLQLSQCKPVIVLCGGVADSCLRLLQLRLTELN